MIERGQLAKFRRWWRSRPRWPLTRQISLIFALTMLANSAVIIILSDIWDRQVLDNAVANMSPKARQTYRQAEKGEVVTASEISQLAKEMNPVRVDLEEQANSVLYALIALAAVITFALGYLIVGRMGKGLVGVANAARRIADGDLNARAAPIKYASREEIQLTTAFNFMSASLQRAERELAESTASIAHELRTPLTILRGRLHGIGDGVFALAPEEIDGLLFQVEGLGRLVDDLQTLSLANSHRLVLNLNKTDLSVEVRRVLAAMQPDLEAAGLDPVLDISETPLLADSVRIRQVIGAVLANACRYAASSGPLRITTWTSGGEAMLQIVDYGPGLPDDTGDRAFDRFWRGEVSRSRNTGGSGLGLAVVRAIVEEHRGRATLSNHAGGGTLFEMHLPAGGLR